MRRFAFAMLVALAFVSPAAATILSSANKVIVAGNGSQTAFTFAFVGVTAADITVLYTDASGNQTALTQGPGATQYQVTLNAAVTPALWGVGGTITYNPSGTPIASGTTLTIQRVLPFTQGTSLQNQASFGQYATATEQALDQLDMQIQQLNGSIGYAVQMNAANSRAPIQLPPAAQLANQGLCGSSTGLDLIACSLAPAGVISSAMAAVVGAASLSAGRTAFGLGTFAVENINAGSCGGPSLADDGAGNARVVLATTADSTGQTVTCNFHLTQRIATGPITYTLGKASSTYFNGFQFTINALAGIVTVTPNASDNFVGVASGTAIAIPAGSICRLTTNAASSATWWIDCNGQQASLAAATGGGGTTLILTLYAPPIAFRNATIATGTVNWAAPANGLSITIPSGATLGTSSSNVPFRIWIFLAYNGGTPELGVATCSIPGAIGACAAWEMVPIPGTAISAGATSAGTLYTSGATSSPDAIRIVGYAEYGSGLATAGTWASVPTALQVCLPPFVCKRPGDVVQTIAVTNGTEFDTTSSTYQTTNLSAAITPTSTPNLIMFQASGNSRSASATIPVFTQMFRGATAVGPAIGGVVNTVVPVSLVGMDAPGTVSSTTYAIKIKNTDGAAAVNFNFTTGNWAGSTSSIILQEIMGAIEPDNDNGEPLRMVG